MPVNSSVAARIRQTAIAGLTSQKVNSTHLSMSSEIIPAGHVFKLFGTTVTARYASVLLFVDQAARLYLGRGQD